MSSSSRVSGSQQSPGEIVKQGSLKKLKVYSTSLKSLHEKMYKMFLVDQSPSRGHNFETMKKKYFVLRADSGDTAACIEYYDSEKKFRANEPPKRSITLKTCFNINKRTDTRHKYVVALYTKNDCFCIVFANEEEMEDWLKSLLELQLGEEIPEGEPVRPYFEHIWDVTVLPKELGSKKNILGMYHLCLTDTSLSLLKANTEEKHEPLQFSLQKIRRCGHFDTFFYMELGQCTVTGPGNLWMQTEDCNIAENMHTTIFNACCSCPKKESNLQPKSRTRSSSANETSKPISLTHRPHPGNTGSANHQRTYSFPLSPVPPTRRTSTGTRPNTRTSSSVTSHIWMSSRERSDSMPSRNRTTSEGGAHLISGPHPRPHSMYNKCNSYSPPINSSPLSPGSATCSDSAGSSYSIDGDVCDGGWDGPSLTPDEPVIIEENLDDYSVWQGGEDENRNNYMPMEPSYSVPIQHNNRKHSPNPSSCGFKSSSPSQGSGVDFFDSSPLDTAGNYLPMSPGESRFAKRVVNHSRDSSIAEDGYVPMAPPQSDDGYVDMDHGSNHNKGSCGSITCGTPSSELRFPEYTLDKVTTYFSPDEDLVPNERPTRAYSVGSRPTTNINRSSDLLSSQTCERVRAFSLGSQNVRSFGKMPPSSSHSSMEPCDDMMELDFSKKARRARKKASSSERLTVPAGSASTLSSAASSYSTAEGSSYMEMSPPRKFFSKSPPKASPPTYPSPSLSRVPEGGEYVTKPGDAYLEMRPGDPKHIIAVNTKVRIDSFPVSKSSPPIKPPLLSRNKDDYLDMSLKRKTFLTEDNNNSKVVAPQPDEYVEMNLGVKTESNPSQDYVTMDMGKEKRGSGRSQPITIQAAKEPSLFPPVGVRKNSSPKAPLHLSLSGSPKWKPRREDHGIFPFSPEGYEHEPPPKCPVDGTSGELKICNEQDDDFDHEDTGPMDRFISGLGTMTILSPNDEQKPSLPSSSSLSPNQRRELHYASLDLIKSGSESEESGRTVRTAAESSSSPSPSLPTDSTPFNYAQIDFAKSSNKPLH